MTVQVLDFMLPEATNFGIRGLNVTRPEGFWKKMDGPEDAMKLAITRSTDNMRNHGLREIARRLEHDLPDGRFGSGAWAYKCAKEAKEAGPFWVPGSWAKFTGDPFFDLDGARSDDGLVFPHPDSDINTPRFELLREGITDFRYLWTLDKLTEDAKARSAQAWHDLTLEGEAFLKDVREKTDADAKAHKPWSDARLDAMRAKAAELISKHVAAGAKLP